VLGQGGLDTECDGDVSGTAVTVEDGYLGGAREYQGDIDGDWV
jgi:hypothetical protein